MWIMWIELLRLRGLCGFSVDYMDHVEEKQVESGLNYEDYVDYLDWIIKIMQIMWIELWRSYGLCGFNVDSMWIMWILWKKSRWKVDWIMKVQKHTVHTRLSHLLWFNKTLLAMWKKYIKHLLHSWSNGKNKRQIQTQPPKPTFRILSLISSLQTDCAQTNYGKMFSHAIKTSVPVRKRQRLELKGLGSEC